MVALVGLAGALEAVALAAAGHATTFALLSAAPPPLSSLHDLALVASLPLPLPVGVVLCAIVIGLRILQLRLLWPSLGMTTVATVVTTGWVLMALPAALLITLSLTTLAYLWLAAAALVAVALMLLARRMGVSGRTVALAAAVVSLSGAAASLLPRWPSAIAAAVGAVAVAASWVGERPIVPVAVRARSLLRGAAAATVVALLFTGVYAAASPAPSWPERPTLITPAVADVPDGGVGARPVLLVDGFASPYRRLVPLDIAHPVWGFSYRGVDPAGRTVPHHAADTLQGVGVAARHLEEQTRVLAEAYDGPVALVGISQGALVVRTAVLQGRMAGLVETVVLVDLPAVGTPLRHPLGGGATGLTGVALRVVAWVGEQLTPLRIDADAALPRELQGCALPSTSQPLEVPEVRLRSLTDGLAPAVAAPEGVEETAYLGAHALTIHMPSGREAIAWALGGDAAAGRPAPLWQGALAILRHLTDAWRLPLRPEHCA